MRLPFGLFLLVFAFLFACFPAQSQQIVPSLVGTDFWISFLRNYQDEYSTPVCSFIIASEFDCTATITNPRTNWDTTVSLNNSVTRVIVPTIQTEPPMGLSLADDGWHINTTAPATVFASNFVNYSHDITAVLPTPVLRNSYMSQTYGRSVPGQQVGVVAITDSTRLDITFAEEVVGNGGWTLIHPGDTVSVLLMQGQVCRLNTSQTFDSARLNGFTGTTFRADKPVALFQGHNCAFVPERSSACDHLYEQGIPTDFWGKHFVVMPTIGRTSFSYQVGGQTIYEYCDGDLVKITARDSNTTLTVGDSSSITLNAGESYTFLLANHPPDTTVLLADLNYLDFYQSDALPIQASSPIQVVFYITGMSWGGTPGDPAAVVVPPIEQGISRTLTAVYHTQAVNQHFINIVAPTTEAHLVTLDGVSIADSFATTTGDYSYARLTIDEGIHVVDADTGRFLATFYGLGNAESYAYIAGMALRSSEYDVRANRHWLCLGDTAVVTVTKADTLSVTFLLDDSTLLAESDTLRLRFDSVGVYRLAVVFSPIGDTVWDIMHVNPTYNINITDTICTGQFAVWNGDTLYADTAWLDTFTTLAGCDSLRSYALTVLDSTPIPGFFLTHDCQSAVHTLTTTLPGLPAGTTFYWLADPPDPTLDTQSFDSLHLTPQVPTRYTFHIQSCNAFDTSFYLTPIIKPEACIDASPTRLDKDHPQLTATDCSRDATHRRWYVEGWMAGNDPQLTLLPSLDEDTVHLALVVDNEYCQDSIALNIPIDHFLLYVPNTFTPGQPVNNRFEPLVIDAVIEELLIFNRNGLLVASFKGDNPLWDGTYRGKPCQQNSYVWQLRYRANSDPSKTVTITGSVMLLR